MISDVIKKLGFERNTNKQDENMIGEKVNICLYFFLKSGTLKL